MIIIRKTKFSELKEISDMSNQSHVLKFLRKKTLEIHERDFTKNNIIYLSIISRPELLAGYIILRIKTPSKSVHLKRILVSEKHLGVGQQAIIATEKYCIKEFQSNYIWLDVYKNNSKAKYIYEKLGYKKFKESIHNLRSVLFYEKNIE